MLIYIVDDAPADLACAERALRQACPEAEIRPFAGAQAALACAAEEGRCPDAVFTGIRMQGLGGLEFAGALRELCPRAAVIFVTRHGEYALEAFRVHARGYVLKPLDPDRAAEELRNLGSPPPRSRQLRVRCFGYFEVFWDEKPLQFQRQQTKELLAYLINREGAACTSEQICAALWEDESDLRMAKNRIRVLLSDLRTTLRAIGMEALILRQSGWIAVDRTLLDCDFYRMLEGDVSAVNAFHGEFMNQYSWAELTAGRLYFHDF